MRRNDSIAVRYISPDHYLIRDANWEDWDVRAHVHLGVWIAAIPTAYIVGQSFLDITEMLTDGEAGMHMVSTFEHDDEPIGFDP
jgi:hypothetical protein